MAWRTGLLDSSCGELRLHLLRPGAYLPQGDLFDFQSPGQEQQRANQDLLLEREGILCVFLAQSHPVPINS